MELSVYDIIKGIILTPKAQAIRKNLGKITFKVNKLSNKVMVRDAVEKIWKVKVRDVRIVNLHGKMKISFRKKYTKPGIKKAIVTLKPGFKIDLPDHYETMGIAETKTKKE